MTRRQGRHGKNFNRATVTMKPGSAVGPRGAAVEALPQYIERYCYGDGKLKNKPGYGSFYFPSQKQSGSVAVKKTVGDRVVVELFNFHGKGGRITIMVDKCPPGGIKAVAAKQPQPTRPTRRRRRRR